MNLKDALKDRLNGDELSELVRSYDIVGDIAIIIIPEKLTDKQHLIGEAVMELNKSVRVVVKRSGVYQGEYRQIPLEVIAGENRLETICHENGVRLKLNLQQVYYSVRSSGERKRIAMMVKPEEEVLVMFSGVAPFPLVIGKIARPASVVGVEKNPEAHKYGLENLSLNKKIPNIVLHQGDVQEIVPGLNKQYHRIIMPLPADGSRYLELGFDHLREGGWLHYYGMRKKDDFQGAVVEVQQACEVAGRILKHSELHVAGHCGPSTYRVCLDCVIE